MINITKIDPDFEIYKNNHVIVWGSGETISSILELFDYFNIPIEAICEEHTLNINTSQQQDHQNLKECSNYKEIPIISLDELKALYAQNNNLTIQIAMDSVFEILVIAKIQMLGVKNYISSQEALNFLGAYKKAIEINKNPLLNNPLVIKTLKNSLTKDLEDKSIDYINNASTLSPLLLCLPPKTGDNTLDNTFKSKNIQHYNYWHTPKAFNPQKINNSKIKIITSVREPIAQNLSLFYSTLSLLNYTNNSYLIKLFDNNQFLTHDNRDAQTFFDIWLDETNYLNYDKLVYSDESSEYKSKFNTIQYFIPQFQSNVLDILAYDFDKEKGYSIIKNNINNINLEIFVYQLEKMNDANLIKDLNNWLDLSSNNNAFEEWLIGNATSNKWIAESYSRAQRELKFSKKYFERCFKEEYVEHFYLESDIQSFKQKYKNNIK
ncbi:MAG: hypothetical protein R3Y29_03205 [bacterium]